MSPIAENEAVALALDELANLLETQGANPHRVRAYRNGAISVRSCTESVAGLYETRGEEALRELPGIGQSLASVIKHLVTTGHDPMLERLRGQAKPEAILQTVPSIGVKTAYELKRHLGINTLRELEDALYAGEVARIPGIGPKRLATIRRALKTRVDDQHIASIAATSDDTPSVEELLELDRQYRDLAADGKLPRLVLDADSDGLTEWAPVWHTVRDDRNYTILFSTSFRARERDATHDWVVIYLDEQDHRGQWTVITARYGAIAGRRIVRGREDECLKLWAEEAKFTHAREQTRDVLEQCRRELGMSM